MIKFSLHMQVIFRKVDVVSCCTIGHRNVKRLSHYCQTHLVLIKDLNGTNSSSHSPSKYRVMIVKGFHMTLKKQKKKKTWLDYFSSNLI